MSDQTRAALAAATARLSRAAVQMAREGERMRQLADRTAPRRVTPALVHGPLRPRPDLTRVH